MAHRHYHTEGLIIRERPVREKDLILSIFTRDLGLVRAIVRSGRDIRSKLRPHGNRYTRVAVSLVRGKEYWRVVGLETVSLFRPIWQDVELARPAAQIFDLLERLVNGEEPAAAIYDSLLDSLELLAALPAADKGELAKNLECVTVLRLLSQFGYLPRLALLEPFVSDEALDLPLLYSLSPVRLDAVRSINHIFNEAGV
jgi:DNA repair protein RecO (recombination protein O)